MGMRNLAWTMKLCKSKQLKHLLSNRPLIIPPSILQNPSVYGVICKVFGQGPVLGPLCETESHLFGGLQWIHSSRSLDMAEKAPEPAVSTETNADSDAGSADAKPKRKKLKGKRAVVKWLKFFRYKKKKDFQRMTAEEKVLFKLRKARTKEERYLEALRKLEPKETSEITHDPEILTPEEHFYFLKMGQKCKNYVPVGRRGIYQGVILNMHLHWKKHQTLQVIVKTFTPEEVKEIAVELARLTGGIVLDVQDENTIIMYRGKNYSQPPTEIMSPRITLPRKKALDKSKYRDGLRAVRKYIPRLEQELELLQAKAESRTAVADEIQLTETNNIESEDASRLQLEASEKLRELVSGNNEFNEDDHHITGSGMSSDSEDLSDIFETDSEGEEEEKAEPHLYLNEFEKFAAQRNGETEDFEEHLRKLSKDSRRAKSMDKDLEPDFDDVDRLVLRAASLLKKKRR